jgi:6-phosphogluconolactonase
MNQEVRIFPTIEKLTDHLVDRIAEMIREKKHDQFFTMAIPGGNTPRSVFEIISREYNNKIDWSKVLLFWGDERCVPPSDPDSNYKMAFDLLLKNAFLPDLNFFRIKGENNPDDEAVRYAGEVDRMLRHEHHLPRFDLIILGMGEDGHTASLFPGFRRLLRSHKLFETTEHPVTGQKRITATLHLINNADAVWFLVTGPTKAPRISHILNREKGWKKLPAAKVHPVDGKVTWLLDEPAAGLLERIKFERENI